MRTEFSLEIGVDVIDIPTMHELPRKQYIDYIENNLFWVDHHDVLRATHGEYPIATSSQQIDDLVDYLKSVAQRMRSAGQ
ncbi:hypothetical protein ACM7OS_22560 [Pseudomonas aeruginosa]